MPEPRHRPYRFAASAAPVILLAAVALAAAGRGATAQAPADAPSPGLPPPALFATGPSAILTATVPVTNPFDTPHVASLEVQPGVDDGDWPIAFGPPRALRSGASARIAVTLGVPIGVVDGAANAVRLHVRMRGNGGSRGWVAERTLYAWTGGDMRVDRYVGCRGDLDASGEVDDADVARVAAASGARGPASRYDPALDFDHDGRLGDADVRAVAGRRGACGPLVDVDTAALRAAVTLPGLLGHLAALQAIADRSDGNRAAGTAGYERSVAYAREQLEAAGYRVEVMPFTYPGQRTPPPAAFEQLAPTPISYTIGADFVQGSLSGGGEVTADVAAVDVVVPPPAAANGNTSGCEAADFGGFPRGAVALLQRGTCPFDDKVANAAAAGAAAVVIFNEGQADRTAAFDPTTRAAGAVPLLGASYALGEAIVGQLRAGSAVRVRIRAEPTVVDLTSYDVIADAPRPADDGADGAADDGVVMIGAHLDSVPAGPGMNDDGSGVAAVLEIARQAARLAAEGGRRPRHRLRFALWGAEELGLWGSRRYVESLDGAARADLLAYLNFDMIASPNPMRGLYDSLPEHDGSDEIEALLGRWFDGLGRPHEKAKVVTGRSDHAWFSAAGVPIGGLFSGLNQTMSAEQAALYGGTAGAPMDPCYHKACDTLANVNGPMLDEMADAAAHALWHLANDDLYPLTSRRARPLGPRAGGPTGAAWLPWSGVAR